MRVNRKLSPPTVVASVSKDDNILLIVFGGTFYCSFSDKKILTFYDWEFKRTSSIFIKEVVITICCDLHENGHRKESSNSLGSIDDSVRAHRVNRDNDGDVESNSNHGSSKNVDSNDRIFDKVFGLTSSGKVFCWQFHLQKDSITMTKVYNFEEVRPAGWID